jgi:hypothetical protein
MRPKVKPQYNQKRMKGGRERGKRAREGRRGKRKEEKGRKQGRARQGKRKDYSLPIEWSWHPHKKKSIVRIYF